MLEIHYTRFPVTFPYRPGSCQLVADLLATQVRSKLATSRCNGIGKRHDTTDSTDFCPRQLITDLLRETGLKRAFCCLQCPEIRSFSWTLTLNAPLHNHFLQAFSSASQDVSEVGYFRANSITDLRRPQSIFNSRSILSLVPLAVQGMRSIRLYVIISKAVILWRSSFRIAQQLSLPCVATGHTDARNSRCFVFSETCLLFHTGILLD